MGVITNIPVEEETRDPLVVNERMKSGEKIAYKLIVQLDRIPDFHGIWGRLTIDKQSEILTALAKTIDKNF